jgi:tetratricopeptide (TPR) repeat protein
LGDIDGVMTAYEEALDAVPRRRAPSAAGDVLRALVARDRVGAMVSGSEDAATLARLASLDERLKSDAGRIEWLVGLDKLKSWRETVHAPAESWWWSLDERAAATNTRQRIAWTVLAVLLLTVSTTVGTEVSRRFLSADPDTLGMFNVLLQLVITLLAGSTLLTAGQQWLENMLVSVGISRRFHHWWRLGFALVVLLVVVGVRLALPDLARYYNSRGLDDYLGSNITSSILNFKRAISLQPDYASAHFNLGSAYETVQQYPAAQTEYETAITADNTYYPAYNNLARLNMVLGGDYPAALARLDRALAELPGASNAGILRYSLLKNRGWARLGLGYFELAERDLRDAIDLKERLNAQDKVNLPVPDTSAHCLLAQLLEDPENPGRSEDEALAQLCTCAGDPVAGAAKRLYALTSPEAGWVSVARMRIETSSKGCPR